MNTVAAIAAVLLGIYLVALVVALVLPARGPDPQRGVAQGCLLFVALGLIALGGLLALGYHFQLRPLVYLVFVVTIFPAFSLVGGGIYRLVQQRRGQW